MSEANGSEQLARLFDGRPEPMAVSEHPASRAEQYGPEALSDSELLALLLQGTMSPESALDIARRMVNDTGSLQGLAKHGAHEFAAYGIGRIKGLQMSALSEIARRMMAPAPHEQLMMKRADQVAGYFMRLAVGLDVEKFWVAALNRKHRMTRCVEITSGTATAALAHPREVFRVAVRHSASAIVCVHNHPSGDPAPSAPDLHITRLLREAAKTMDIEMLDHVILGRPGADPLGRGFYSFRDAGLL